jgi:hypothetical protein
MKRILNIVMVTALVAITFSCDDVETTPQFTKSDTEITATPSVSSVAVTASDSLKAVISFSWNDPEYAIGLDESKFNVKVGAADGNFASFLSKEFTGVLTGSLLGKELNGMALRFGGAIGQPITLDVMVVASQSNNNEPKNSNIMKITVTPYGDLGLAPSTTSVELNATTASALGLGLTWNPAFVGFKGVRTYQLQYAKGGTSFATPTSVDMTSFSKSFTHFELNKIALAFGMAAGVAGPVDFRIKATNELGTVLYSNVATVSLTPYIAFNSLGIIGDATAGGWSIDTDMRRPDPAKPTEWTITTKLTGGKNINFRADDDWVDKWGISDIAPGTAVAGSTASAVVPSDGYYKIDFNVGTAAYSFTPVTTTVFTNISLIGEQTNWGPDIADLTKDPANDQVWTGTVNLTAGKLKFRANHAWATSWGAPSGSIANSLSGYSSTTGSDLVISTAGEYFVYINVASGEYHFGKTAWKTPFNDIGLVGPAQAGGWDADTNLIKNPANPYKWSGNITLVADVAKFRADNDWVFDWGSGSFPSGIGTKPGDNIPVNSAGTYTIAFNSLTGEYTFTK